MQIFSLFISILNSDMTHDSLTPDSLAHDTMTPDIMAGGASDPLMLNRPPHVKQTRTPSY